MVKMQDFIIAGLLVFGVLFGTGIIVADLETQYDLDITNSSTINLDDLNALINLTDSTQKELDTVDSDESSGLITGVVNAFKVASLAIGSVPIVGQILFSTASDFGIHPVFVGIAIAIMTIVFVFLLISLFTGRFV